MSNKERDNTEMSLPNNIVSLILTYGASEDLCSSLDQNVVILAAKMLILGNPTYEESLDILRREWNVLDAIHYGNLSLLHHLLKIRDFTMYEIERGLFWSSHYNHLSVLLFFLTGWKHSKYSLNMALKEACWCGHSEVVRILVERKARIEGALKNAAHCNHLEIVKYLIEKGSKDKNCALYWAQKQSNSEIVSYLKSQGCKLDRSVKYNLDIPCSYYETAVQRYWI